MILKKEEGKKIMVEIELNQVPPQALNKMLPKANWFKLKKERNGKDILELVFSAKDEEKILKLLKWV